MIYNLLDWDNSHWNCGMERRESEARTGKVIACLIIEQAEYISSTISWLYPSLFPVGLYAKNPVQT